MRNKNIKIIGCLLACVLFVSCGTSRQKMKVRPAEAVVLTPEQQRKYDYFFLEAARLKVQKDYDAAFDLLQHCLTINPNASSALYELAQYYLYLKQAPQGQAALEKAVENDPDNYWYSQGLANLYQQQDEKEKAMKLLEDMSVRFTDKLDPLYALLDIYNRQEQYDKVIATLNRIEGKTGKSEQLSMEKFRIYLQMKDNKNVWLRSIRWIPVIRLCWETCICRTERRKKHIACTARCWIPSRIMLWRCIRWRPIMRRPVRKTSTSGSWILYCSTRKFLRKQN